MLQSAFRGPIGIALISSFLFGCSHAPKILARNEINEPVFHETHYAALGGSTTYDYTWRGMFNFGGGHDFLTLPYLAYERKVASWASFSLWPLFWNFRLTGDQYAEDGELRTGALMMALHGGVSGASYSQRDGWLFTGALGLNAKYRFGAAWFADAEAGAESGDLAALGDRRYGFAAALGNQVSPRNSLKLGGRFDYFDLARGSEIENHGLYFRDGDNRMEAVLGHAFYPTPQHALGTEAGIGFLKGEARKGYYLTLGFHYDFRFR